MKKNQQTRLHDSYYITSCANVAMIITVTANDQSCWIRYFRLFPCLTDHCWKNRFVCSSCLVPCRCSFAGRSSPDGLWSAVPNLNSLQKIDCVSCHVVLCRSPKPRLRSVGLRWRFVKQFGAIVRGFYTNISSLRERLPILRPSCRTWRYETSIVST